MTTQVEKLTVSVPRNLIDIADTVAKEKKISRSKVVAECLQELADKRLEKELEEGYKAMEKEDLEFAHTAADLAHEVLPEWK